MSLTVEILPILSDNYIFVIQDDESQSVAVVDPAQAEPVMIEAEVHDWQVQFILNTHHHMDHVGGNKLLKQQTGAMVIGPKADHQRIPVIDQAVKQGDQFELFGHTVEVFDVPGHTRGHIAYLVDNKLFCGDTLFSLGCGRLFEGTPAQMIDSLKKFSNLKDDTEVYCTHEYALQNAKFSKKFAQKHHLSQYLEGFEDILQELSRRRQGDHYTVPSTLGFERRWNLFLRFANGIDTSSWKDPESAFAELRRAKDHF